MWQEAEKINASTLLQKPRYLSNAQVNPHYFMVSSVTSLPAVFAMSKIVYPERREDRYQTLEVLMYQRQERLLSLDVGLREVHTSRRRWICFFFPYRHYMRMLAKFDEPSFSSGSSTIKQICFFPKQKSKSCLIS